MIAFLRWPMKRSAMYSGEGMRELPIGDDGADALAGSEQILIGDDDLLAFLQSLQDFRAIQIAKTDLHGARCDDIILDYQHMIGEHGARGMIRTFSRLPAMIFISPVMPDIRLGGGLSSVKVTV